MAHDGICRPYMCNVPLLPWSGTALLRASSPFVRTAGQVVTPGGQVVALTQVPVPRPAINPAGAVVALVATWSLPMLSSSDIRWVRPLDCSGGNAFPLCSAVHPERIVLELAGAGGSETDSVPRLCKSSSPRSASSLAPAGQVVTLAEQIVTPLGHVVANWACTPSVCSVPLPPWARAD